MKSINLCLSIHQRYDLKNYRFFEIGNDHYYYNDYDNEEQLRKFVDECYIKCNNILLDLIRQNKGFKVSFALTGLAMEQFEQFAPEVLDSFRALAKSGAVEFLGTTYSNSLASIYSEKEFERQIVEQREKVYQLFGVKPVTFANTALIYSDEIAAQIYKCGYKNIIIENAKHILGWQSEHSIYGSTVSPKLRLLVRDDSLSDLISFKFSNPQAKEYPVKADKMISAIASTGDNEQVFNILMGYEAFGILNNEGSGIFEFLKALPFYAEKEGVVFSTPSKTLTKSAAAAQLTVLYPYAWADEEKTMRCWNGNDLQQEALQQLYSLCERVHKIDDAAIQLDWSRLQDEKHFFFMQYSLYRTGNSLTKYESAYNAFINYMNVLSDFIDRVKSFFPQNIEDEELNALLQTISNQEEEIARLNKRIKNKG